MADDEEFGSGVTAVFDAIASHRDEIPEPKPVPTARPQNSLPPPVKKSKTSSSDQDVDRSDRPAARVGRFPGSKNGPLKEKITARVAPELRDSYVNWALDDRCPIQDLYERALTEFYQRHRAKIESGK